MDRQTIGLDQEQILETRELIKAAFLLARALEIRTLVLQQNELVDLRLVGDLRSNERIIWASRDGREWPSFDPPKDILLRVPHADAAPVLLSSSPGTGPTGLETAG
jgi:hypothetical protein